MSGPLGKRVVAEPLPRRLQLEVSALEESSYGVEENDALEEIVLLLGHVLVEVRHDLADLLAALLLRGREKRDARRVAPDGGGELHPETLRLRVGERRRHRHGQQAYGRHRLPKHRPWHRAEEFLAAVDDRLPVRLERSVGVTDQRFGERAEKRLVGLPVAPQDPVDDPVDHPCLFVRRFTWNNPRPQGRTTTVQRGFPDY